jgi:predicted nucleic acid-binding protein
VAERQVTFVDTNVLAYAHDRSETRKQPVARARLEALWHSRTGALSTQVLQELYVATRKLAARWVGRPPGRSWRSRPSGRSCRSMSR